MKIERKKGFEPLVVTIESEEEATEILMALDSLTSISRVPYSDLCEGSRQLFEKLREILG